MKRILRQVHDILRDVMDEYSTDNGSLVAAAMAFFGLLSLIPLLLLAIGVFGFFLGSQQAYDQVLRVVGDYLPVGTENLRENLDAIRSSSTLFGGLGLLALLWSGSTLFVILQQAMNIAIGVEKRLGFVRGRLRALLFVFAAGLLFALSIGITAAIAAIRGYDLNLPGTSIDGISLALNVIATLVPVVISIATFFLIYKFLPTAEMGIRGPLVGGITAGALFELAKWGFSVYVANFANFSAVYGSVTGVIVVVLWIYYVAIITVFCAELASVLRRRERSRQGSPG